MTLLTLIGRIYKIASVLLGILIIYWLFLKISGHSPTIEEVNLGITSILVMTMFGVVMFLVKLNGVVGELNGMLKEHIKSCDRRFDILEASFREHINRKTH